MKILHVNTSDIGGGAARAAYRIHHGILGKGEESLLFVKDKQSDDKTVLSLSGKKEKIKKIIARAFDLSIFRCNHVKVKTPWSIGENIFSTVNYINNVHCTNR